MQVYFARPYRSWERGTNEHTNGWLRQFLPKGEDFRNVPRRELKYDARLLNERPRRRLGYRTPAEVFQRRLAMES